MGQRLTYLDDTCLTEGEYSVVGVEPAGEWVVDVCLFHPQGGAQFHPQGGAQPADRGWVDGVEAAPVRDHERGRVLLVPTGGALVWTEGQRVAARVDRQLRLQHEALHTAGYLIEAAGRSLVWELADNNHFPGQARIEFTPGIAPLPDTPEMRERAAGQLRKFVRPAITAAPGVVAATDDEGHRIVTSSSARSPPVSASSRSSSPTRMSNAARASEAREPPGPGGSLAPGGSVPSSLTRCVVRHMGGFLHPPGL
jgi:hypothetical protein